MELAKGVEAIGKSLYLKDHKALVIADLHLGMEGQYINKGVLLPKFLLKDVLSDLDKIFSQAGEIEMLVINGDFKHEFGKILRSEWKEVTHFVEKMLTKVKHIIIIKGNHDIVLGSMKQEVELVDDLKLGNVLFVHGDVEPTDIDDVDVIVMGHEHPALSLQEGGRKEKFKCYLRGRYKKKTLIVQPSFHTLSEGTDIRQSKTLSPILDNATRLEAFVVGENEILDFGQLDKIKA